MLAAMLPPAAIAASSSSAITAVRPWAAARCSGVQPFSSNAASLAGSPSNSHCTTCTCPAAAALCRGVDWRRPAGITVLVPPTSVTSSWSSGRWPKLAAARSCSAASDDRLLGRSAGRTTQRYHQLMRAQERVRLPAWAQAMTALCQLTCESSIMRSAVIELLHQLGQGHSVPLRAWG